MSLSPFLQRCIDLARLGGSAAAPNPKVGSVVVHEGKIIGEGYHMQYGGPHAEVNAVNSVADKSLLASSTIYVSLEPCSFFGNTPPCADLILKHKIPKVVIGSIDPHPKVAGNSVRKLREHGVEVEICEDPTPFHELNRVFRMNQKEKRPYIILKWAESEDGFIAGLNDEGQPVRTQITITPESKRITHRLRAECAAMLVGKRTAHIDNPRMDTRHVPGPDPIRIVFDRDLSLSKDLHIFAPKGKLILLNEVKTGEEGHVSYMNTKGESMETLLQRLYKEHKIGSILVEGGTHIHSQLITAGLFDELYRFVGFRTVGAGVKAPQLPEHLRKGPAENLGVEEVFHWKRPIAEI